MATARPNNSSAESPAPRRCGLIVAAAVYAAWLVFLLVLGLTQPHAERPASPSRAASSPASPQVNPQGS